MVTLHGYQDAAASEIGFFGSRGLLWDMGLGKTITSLEAMRRLGNDALPALIVAPLRCCEKVWPAEIEKHGFDFSCAICHGGPEGRRAGLDADADITTINPEGLQWLTDTLRAEKRVPFRSLWIDESTRFKNPESKRFRELRALLQHIPLRFILTGTPIPQGYPDLWSQIYILDGGRRLGATHQQFLETYFNFDWAGRPVLKKGAKEAIDRAVQDIVLRGDAGELLDMPDLIRNDIQIELSEEERNQYDAIEKQTNQFNLGQQYARLRTWCAGFEYLEDEEGNRNGEFEIRHTRKMEALEEVVCGIGGKNLLVAYNFRAERKMLVDRFGCPFIDGETSKQDGNDLVDRWCKGEIPMLGIHPKSVGAGLNLQSGGRHLVWMSPPNSSDDWAQTNARLWRQGQPGSVTIHRLLIDDTLETSTAVLLRKKVVTQEAFLDALKQRLGK